MKYNKREYSVRDSFCSKLIDICFIPFSGNGINICRNWELGNCPTNAECREKLRLHKIWKKGKNSPNDAILKFGTTFVINQLIVNLIN